ncbi:zeta toxin family protein [Streptomyces sp. NPDC060333]|uniref:zeta toxin family protein n=1 Tax=Streptomyces sp. NPDC060333 TaxID=3347098 RepID=UPI00365578B8
MTTPLDPRKHVLPPEEHEQVRQDIRRLLIDGPASSMPTLTILGGIPGSGKSTLAGTLLAGRDAVQISADSLSEFHPRWPRLLRDDDSSAGFHVRDDAVRWVDDALGYARELRRDVLFDTALANADRARTVLTQYREAGYQTDIALVAAPASMSELGVLDRYLTDRALRGGAQFVNDPNSLLPSILSSVRTIINENLARSVAVYTRDSSTPVFRAEADPSGRWRPSSTADSAFSEARERPWAIESSTWFADTAERVAKAKQEQLGPGLQRRWHGLLSHAVQTAQPYAHPSVAERLEQLAGSAAPYTREDERARAAHHVSADFQRWSQTAMGIELMGSTHPAVTSFREAWQKLSATAERGAAGSYAAVGLKVQKLHRSAVDAERFSSTDLAVLARVGTSATVHGRRLSATTTLPTAASAAESRRIAPPTPRIQPPPPEGRRGPTRGL